MEATGALAHPEIAVKLTLTLVDATLKKGTFRASGRLFTQNVGFGWRRHVDKTPQLVR